MTGLQAVAFSVFSHAKLAFSMGIFRRLRCGFWLTPAIVLTLLCNLSSSTPVENGVCHGKQDSGVQALDTNTTNINKAANYWARESRAPSNCSHLHHSATCCQHWVSDQH
jgi:hypothetical protein